MLQHQEGELRYNQDFLLFVRLLNGECNGNQEKNVIREAKEVINVSNITTSFVFLSGNRISTRFPIKYFASPGRQVAIITLPKRLVYIYWRTQPAIHMLFGKILSVNIINFVNIINVLFVFYLIIFQGEMRCS